MDQPLKQWLTGEKYLENEKRFLDEVKKIIVFKGLAFGEKNKNLMKNSGHKLQIFVLNTNTEHCTQNEVFHSGFLQSFQSLTNALVTFSQNIVYLLSF